MKINFPYTELRAVSFDLPLFHLIHGQHWDSSVVLTLASERLSIVKNSALESLFRTPCRNTFPSLNFYEMLSFQAFRDLEDSFPVQ